MKQLSPFAEGKLTNISEALKFYMLVEFLIPDTPVRLTGLPYDITMSDSRVFTSDTRLVAADPLRTASVLDRSEYKVIISDPQRTTETLLNAKGFSCPLTVWAGFYNSSTGQPVNTWADTMTIYSGLIDSWSLEATPGETLLLLVQGTNPMGMLDWNNPFYSSPTGVKRYRPNDTSMDFIGALNQEEVTVRWGKK